jgi:hypothetical protein
MIAKIGVPVITMFAVPAAGAVKKRSDFWL